MPSLADIKELIELDGGIVSDISQHRKIGCQFREPSKDEITGIEKKYGICYWSRFLIVRYAGTVCSRLNNGLRNEGKQINDKFCQKYKIYLNQSLDEISSHNDQTVWRWIDKPEIISYLKKCVGMKIMIPQFLSTSTYKNEANTAFFKIKTCQNSNGKYIAEIVNKPAEREVLFKSNTVFEILGYKHDTVVMQEKKSEKYDLNLGENFWEN